jgi:hypothetical protein
MLQVLHTGKTYQQEPFDLKDVSVLPGLNHLKNALLSCGNASENHKVIGKAKKKKTIIVQGY